MDSPLKSFGAGDHELLVKIVKETQRRGSAGSQGPWKTFLASLPRDDQSKAIQNDPGRRDWNTLAAFCATLVADEDVELVQRMRDWHAWLKEEERLEREDPFPLSPEENLVAKTRQHPTYKQGYELPSYQEGWARSRRGRVSDAPGKTRLLSIDCEMCKAEGNPKELVRLSVMDQDLKVLLSEFVKPSAKVLDYRTEITGASAKSLEKVTYTHADSQKAVLRLLAEPGTVLLGHGLQHDLRALKIDHRRVIDTSLIFSYAGLPTAIPALGDLCRAVLGVGFREGGPESTHDSIEDAKIPMRLVLHELRSGPTPPLMVPDVKVDKSELSKLFLHKIPKGTPREDLARAFPSGFEPHVQMVTWGASGTGTTFAVFKNPEVANNAFKALVGKEHKDALGRAQKSVTVLPAADASEGQRVTFTVRKMGAHNGAAFGVKEKGLKTSNGSGETAVDNRVKEAVRGEGGEQADESGMIGSAEETGHLENDSNGKAKKHGKSSAERRKARRALDKKATAGVDSGGVLVGAQNASKQDSQRTSSGKRKRERSRKEVAMDAISGKDKRKQEEGKKCRRAGTIDDVPEKNLSKRKTMDEGTKKKRRRHSEGDACSHRESADASGHVVKSSKRNRSDKGGQVEKKRRKSEPSWTQQTLMEIQKLIASVTGGPHGKASVSGVKMQRKNDRKARKGKADSARREKKKKQRSSSKAESRSEEKLRRELEKKNDQVAALTKIVLKMAK